MGLIPLVNSYLASMNVDADTHCTVQRYLKLIQRRASGELLTTAAWLRKQVTSHPEYKLVLLFILEKVLKVRSQQSLLNFTPEKLKFALRNLHVQLKHYIF